VFANKYGLDLKDLMTLNYITDDSEILYEGQEIFINLSEEKLIIFQDLSIKHNQI
jgi:LysM repeat protein